MKQDKAGFKLSVIVPVYNEKATIAEILKRIQEVDISKEIIIVDDASTDGTAEYLRMLEKDIDAASKGIRIFYHAKNQGKGAALRTGFAHADGSVVIVQDADLEYDPQNYPRLIRPILEGDADVVFGSRFIGSEPHRVLFFWHYLGNRFLTLFSNMMTNLNLTDMETGMKAFRRETIQAIEIKSNRFNFEPEITAKVARGGCRVYEVAVSYHGRDYSQGKKITWKDGFSAIIAIVRYAFFD